MVAAVPNNVIFGQCLSCGKNNRHRGGRNYWHCRYCKAKNPGPDVIKQAFSGTITRAGMSPDTGAPHAKEAVNGGPNGHTTITSGATKPVAAKPVVKPPAAATKKPAAAPGAVPEKQRSLLSKVLHG